MKILNIEIKRLESIPQVPYDKMRQFLSKHASLHYFVHSTYCILTLGYYSKPYIDFLKESHSILK